MLWKVHKLESSSHNRNFYDYYHAFQRMTRRIGEKTWILKHNGSVTNASTLKFRTISAGQDKRVV